MPFIRYTRDKRGYEHTCVMHAYRSASGAQRTRVLYLFRSPAHVKVGRTPLDEEAREALEHTHPDLSFDWTAVQREIVARPAPRERRGRPGGRSGRAAAPPASARDEAAPVVDDQSTLGRALGAAEAARLRTRYADLLQRILRRARTPEDRDRLTERAQRLNPDEWPGETEAREGAQTIEAEWDAVAAELPHRRRGRRGGRRRTTTAPGDGEAGSSGIIETGQEGVEGARPDDDQEALADRVADDRGDGDRLGAGTDVASGPAGDGLPGDGELH